MKRFGTPGSPTHQKTSLPVATSQAAASSAVSNQHAQAAMPSRDRGGHGWLSSAWRGFKGLAGEMGHAARGGAATGAALGAMPGAALGAGVGGLFGSVAGPRGTSVGASAGGGLLGAMTGVVGAGFGSVTGLITRGLDEFRSDDAALLEKTADISSYHVLVEQFAHSYAYGKGDLQTLEAWGYDLAAEYEDKNSGFRCVAFKPLSEGTLDPDGNPLKPVVAFRGTANQGGALDDVNDQGIGAFQFSRNEKEIERTLAAARTSEAPDVTGHSLGGALAQLAAARLGGMVGDIITFQSPGIPAEEVAKIDAREHAATHYRTGGDVLSDAGEAHARGKVFTFESKGPDSPLSHMSFPLAELNALRKQHDMNLPIVHGARTNADTWVADDGAAAHEGRWAEAEAHTKSRLLDVDQADRVEEAGTTRVTRMAGTVLGINGRDVAETARKKAGAWTGAADRQSAYAKAWKSIRQLCYAIVSPDEVPRVRSAVVNLLIDHGVEVRDHAKFISQAEAAMIEALEASPLNAGGPAPA